MWTGWVLFSSLDLVSDVLNYPGSNCQSVKAFTFTLVWWLSMEKRLWLSSIKHSVFVVLIPVRFSSSGAWDVTLIYTFTFTDVTLVWHKGCGYQQTRSVPLDWVFVVLFICVRGSPKSEILLSHCNITLVWHKGRHGQSHLIGSLLYPPALLSQWELWKWRTINNTRHRDYAIQRYSRS